MANFNFDVQIERGTGRARVAVRGELDLGTTGRLERCLAELFERREPVLLDLRELTFMDSTGLCALLKAREQAQAAEWPLAMVRPAGQALVTLRQSGAERLLPFVEGE
jgi:anti-sigma B factor antagonist